MRWLKENIFLIFLLTVAAVVRFWGFSEMDYHHDEISALLRTRFEDFGTLVDRGIRIDGHPGLVQWFLWLWTGAFGYAPWVVKLPFILTGIATVWLTYLVGKAWFSNRSGWMAAAMMAVLQYAVTFSQWARPYACGLFFVLLAVLFLLRYIQEGKRWMLVVFAVSAALCGYTHYLALLQVMVVSLLIVAVKARRSQWKFLIAGGLLALVLWLPHLNITLGHLSIGGIGEWLKPPEGDWWMHLLGYSFHYSWVLRVLVVGMVLMALFNLRGNRGEWVDRVLLIGAWLIPFVIAFVYSHRVSALMHYGSMLFTFPFLVLLVASFSQAYHRSTVKILAVLFMIIGVHTLFVKRQHLEHNIRTEYQDPLEYVQLIDQELHPDLRGRKIKVVADLRADAVDFLQEKGIVDYSRVQLIEPLWDARVWAHYLDTLSADGILIVTTPASKPEYAATAQWYYNGYINGRYYHTACANLYFRNVGGGSTLLAFDELDEGELADEYSPAMESEVDPSIWEKFPWFYFNVRTNFAGQTQDAQLVYEWQANDGRKEWRSSLLRDFRQPSPEQMAFNGGAFRDLPGIEGGGTLKAYVWNPSGAPLYLDFIQMAGEQGLVPSYGLFEPIPDFLSKSP